MATSSELIEQLKSPKWDRRFEACEFLRVSRDLSEAARSALDAATQDPDRRVAEAAQDALRAHADDLDSAEEPPVPDQGQIVAGVVKTSVLGILALVGLAIWVSYITTPPSPYPMPDLVEGAIFFTLCCPIISLVLLFFALYLGFTTLDSYKARRSHASVSAPKAAENRTDNARASKRSKY